MSFTEKDIKVLVVAYKNRIIIIPHEPEKGIGDGWYPTGKTRFGCVLLNTKNRLGVSNKAFQLMEKIRPNKDAIGDISWFKCSDGTYAFSWFGSIHRVINPYTAEGSRYFRVSSILKRNCIIIPNNVPNAAKQKIDADPNTFSWAEPFKL